VAGPVNGHAPPKAHGALIEEIVVDVNEAGDTIEAVIHGKGGIHSTCRVRKNTTGHRRVGADKTQEIVAQMSERFSDEDIALTLNRISIRTSTGLMVTLRSADGSAAWA
jgi:hypothetical protein